MDISKSMYLLLSGQIFGLFSGLDINDKSMSILVQDILGICFISLKGSVCICVKDCLYHIVVCA